MIKPYRLPEFAEIRPLLLPSLFIYFMVLILLPEFGHDWDTSCWANWTSQLKLEGLVSAYDSKSNINYLPLFLYVLKGFGYLVSEDYIYANIYKLKAITWLFDMGSILLLCSMVKSESSKWRYFIFGLFNIGFFYNTIIWNQVDGILAFFIFSSFYYAFYKKTFLSILLFVLGLNFKLQGIVFAPVLLALWWPNLNGRKAIFIGLSMLLLQSVIVLPYLINGNAKNIMKVAFGSVDYFQFVSMNAFNLWHILLDGDLMLMPDNTPLFLGFTYKSIGLLLFTLATLLICIPLYLSIYKAKMRRLRVEINPELLLLSMTLICYTFFFFNTQMHERYIHPVILFLTALAFLYGKWLIWAIVSMNYAFSLEYICNYFKFLPNHYSIYYPEWMAWIYLIGLLLLLIEWKKALPERPFSLR